jgi:hypothetical protein
VLDFGSGPLHSMRLKRERGVWKMGMVLDTPVA